jgi:hypothetical protein
MSKKKGKRNISGHRDERSVENKAREERLKGFKNFNLAAGVIHLLQGLLMLALTNDFTITVTRGYLEFNTTTRSLEPESTAVVDLWLGPFIASFLFMSAIAHFLIGTVLYDRYVGDLRKGMNRFRWYEYSVSASVMIVAIAMLVGIYDVSALILIFFMNAMMIAWGHMMETHNQLTEETDWTPFILGCVAGIIPWVVIAIHLWGAGGDDGGPPDFVYWIFVSIGVARSTALPSTRSCSTRGGASGAITCTGSGCTSSSAWLQNPCWRGRSSRERCSRIEDSGLMALM